MLLKYAAKVSQKKVLDKVSKVKLVTVVKGNQKAPFSIASLINEM